MSNGTYLEHKYRSLAFFVPKLRLYRGKASAYARVLNKRSVAIGRAIAGSVYSNADVISKTYVAHGRPIRAGVYGIALINGAARSAVGVPIVTHAASIATAIGRERRALSRAINAWIASEGYARACATMTQSDYIMGRVSGISAPNIQITISTLPAYKGLISSVSGGGGRLSTFSNFDYVRGRISAFGNSSAKICRSTVQGLSGYLTTHLSIGLMTQKTSGVAVCGAVSAHQATSGRLRRARRTTIADAIGRPISDYIGVSIADAEWTEL